MQVPHISQKLLRLASWRRFSERESPTNREDEQPLRAELFSADQLERHAKTIAATHQLASGRSQNKLLPRLDENARVLIETYDLVTAAAAQNRPIEPAAEWLLDNFYLIEEQIRAIRRLLPPSYSKQLPRLAEGPGAGFPRVYGIALELISHVDGHIDATSLNSFIASYQSVESLMLGELWAVPLMLRLALIENLRRVAVRIALARRDRDLAGDWADQMVQIVEQNPTDLILVLADMARNNPPLSGAFLAEMTRHLQGQNPNFAFANSWLEHRLADQGLTTEQLVRAEGRAQAADQVSIGNSINSLRFLDSNDWREFVGQHSLVEQTLAGDPSCIYAEMDFATRDRYRHAVEGIARRSKLSEYAVARKAVQLAENHAREAPDERAAHVGYYLIDRGRPVLERLVEMRLSPIVVLDKLIRRYPLFCYLAVNGFVTFTTTLLFLLWLTRHDASWLVVGLLAIPVMICASHLGIGIVNWLTARLLSPQSLPRMDFEQGIPAEGRTLAAVPTMLTSASGIEHLLDGLEIRYLSNRDQCLHFALVTDFVDAATASTPDDAELVRLAREGIERLNEKYADVRNDIFHLFHRPRSWNAQEGVWMGYERKRGKLADLNATLRGATDRFTDVVGQTAILQSVRYVITLDTDTQMPRDAARLMVGTLAHRLNRPVFDKALGRVIDGYTILQPRVGVSLTSTQRSRFAQLFSGDPGVDPYTRVVSDVYQDLFGEGSFIGKGIYDVDSFEQSCGDFPENAILSHDLIEGAYARSALLSDVILYEEYPSRYAADISRRHRWMRGDWQIAAWVTPWAPSRAGKWLTNPISILSRWKIFDNLRRSLSPIAILLTLMISWFASPSVAAASLLFVLSTILLPTILDAASDLFRKSADVPLRMHLRLAIQALGRPLAHSALTLAFLPYETYISVDSIVRTLIRMTWTKRRLLEWRTSSDSERNADDSLVGAFRAMWVAPILATATFLALFPFHRGALLYAAVWLAIWLASPLLAWRLSQPIRKKAPQLSEDQRHFLEKLSRKTFRYFEDFVTAENNWLPPDNVQQNPELVIAPRTSPTNIGMGLLVDLAAYDFGYCSAAQMLTRTQRTLDTMHRMERYRGHFFNWYDTRTLAPLHPRYVSMVDSGNLAGNLLVLSSGFAALGDAPLLPPRMIGGLRDTLRVLLEVAQGVDVVHGAADVLRKIERQIEDLDQTLTSLSSAHSALARLTKMSAELKIASGENEELKWWANAYDQACLEHHRDLTLLASWVALPAPPPQLNNNGQIGELLKRLNRLLTLREVAELEAIAIPPLEAAIQSGSADTIAWLSQLKTALSQSAEKARERIAEFQKLAAQSLDLAEMDFGLLYNSTRDLFAIGYSVSEHRLDASFYDLLASEARLASFIVIAQNKFGQEHWFALGRLLTSAGSAPALLSWSGSMFEYLMPLLVMPNYENTLLDRTYHAVVRRQIEYGRQRGVPWGISESGYNAIDQHKTYQYRAFGVPGLGLKRGLAEDLVIAPYASVLALMVEPEAACRNLERLAADGQLGAYGFYEAVDYTPSRLPPGSDRVSVRQFMAHHEGMSLLSLAYLLLDKPMQRRFLADPMLRAADLLLQERVPKASAPVYPHASEANATRLVSAEESGNMRVFTDPSASAIEAHLLSNGRYHVAVTSAGGGYSRWRDLAITRWREDATKDDYGSFCYVRDVESGVVWSNAWQPTTKSAKGYEAIFTQARAEFRRSDNQIETYTQICVSPEDDIELRRITLTNRSELPRTLELTSYAEVVLATQAQDEAHPAFSNLFVETELVREHTAIYCTRRPRSAEEQPPWITHMMTVRGETVGEPSYETDRMRFVGRHKTLVSPAALNRKGALSNSAGSVLDPIVSVRQTVLLQPNESMTIDIVTGAAETRAGVQSLTEKYGDPSLTDRVFDIAWTHSHILLTQLNASETDAQVYGRLASSIIYASTLHRAKASILALNRQGQSGLWGYGISGDLPIVLVRIRDHERLSIVHQAVQAHSYWRMKGLAVDLVIWNEDDSVYRQTLQDSIVDLVAASPEAPLIDRPGGVFIRRGEQMSDEDRALLQTVARIVLLDDAGTLAEQVERRGRAPVSIPHLRPTRSPDIANASAESPDRDLAFFNGLGGFSQDGREYVTTLAAGQTTPAPWVNVIANSQFGAVVSEGGSSYTWAENSHEYRLTPWRNDPVSDLSGEAIYVRDEETGSYWSPTPLPARGGNSYVVRHGFGYSIFDYSEDGITTELCIYVDPEAPVKIYKLKIANHSGRRRQLSVTGYWELVLGEIRGKSLMHIVTEADPASGAIMARNVYNAEFGDRVAFVNCSESNRTCTGDRAEFIGRNGKLTNPSAMRRVRLSGRIGAGYDPCAAFQAPLTLEVGQERTITFILGATVGAKEASALAQEFRSVDRANQAIEEVWHFWSRTLGVIHLESPDPAVNYLANGWLVYQTLACRMWARSGFYQSGGAFGFRDQLQDAMALVHAQPQLLREHLLRAAAHQFREGDVQHWWHPPVGRGVRTHFSDDYLWLPLAICRYVEKTGDTGVLDETAPFLSARLLRSDEESCYDLPHVSDDIGTLYEHGKRAIDRGLQFGEHGLPLMGCGDWNDGMNLVGEDGRGESVWLAFFLYYVLEQFAQLARRQGDLALADRYSLEAGRLRGNIEEHGWDGQWYRRAYFDDGTPLGSSSNEECQIDAIAQSWSVLSGGGTHGRPKIAMESVNRRLVRRDARLILLLDPPFDKSDLNPGYIKGYVPGVRENGGQYTHSAIWTVMAAAAMGDNERAWELFSLINPISHGATPDDIAQYRVEPYVAAADVYGVEPHTGRGGWTWYTGSSGWMYRLIVESLLGLHLEGDKMRITPCLPADWTTFQIHYRFRETFYHITIHNHGAGATVCSMTLDGAKVHEEFISLVDDQCDHEVVVEMQPI
ncbi:GH36-type glycosyl hydrolase domain-containing protein [Blastopirellula marina]|uniref:Cyclic beta 1-2 glucan synthetase n=1 Tax=Blastopirellula marina DSM 3645 TaxID=314230 RepID=A3ZX49_9BACT|nr:glucoamylase family protein [Blastopirellula marina]EAQ78926.1 cyclic beta 1-2 glucan synthetase [Blastopirellula marina DSM 3645]